MNRSTKILAGVAVCSFAVLLTTVSFVAMTAKAEDLVVVPKQAPLAAHPEANVGITPDGDIVIVPVKTIRNGVAIPIIISKEDAAKQREEMLKRKAERAAKAKASKAVSSSSVRSND
jgi:hypothetical protein